MKKTLSLLLLLLLVVLPLATACGDKAMPEDVFNSAVEMFEEYNKPGASNIVAADFELPAKIVDYEGYDLTIAWTVEGGNGLVSVESKDENTALIKVNKYADEDTEFSLKGVVSYGKLSKEVVFQYVIKKYVISDWAYWAENTKDVNMNIRGIVVAKTPYSSSNKNTSVFLQDEDGEHGYYAYRLKCATEDAYNTDLAIGNVLEVNGTTSLYNGFREFAAGCTYDVVKNEDGSVKTAEVVKVALDDLIAADKDLNQYQGMICTLTGFKVKSLDWNTNDASTYVEKGAGSVYVTLEKDGKTFKAYLSTSNTLTIDELKAEFEKLSIGYTVNLEGPMAWYNAAQIYPCAGGFTVTSTEVTNEDKIAAALSGVTLPTSLKENDTITLPTASYYADEVTFAWAVPADQTNLVLADNAITVTIGDATADFDVTLTASIGETKQEKTFTIRLIVGEPSYADIVTAVYALEDGKSLAGLQTLYGTVSVTDSKNYLVVEGAEDKPIQLYNLHGTGASDIKADDKITVEGYLKNFKGTYEFNGCYLVGTGEIRSSLSIATEAFNLDEGVSMEGTQTVRGYAVVKVGEKYTDYYIVPLGATTEQKIQCYKLSGGEVLTDLTTLKDGDMITVEGTIKNYKGTVEFDTGCKLTAYKASATAVTEIFALANGKYADTTYILTGEVKSLDSKGNPYIFVEGMEDGKTILCYGLTEWSGTYAKVAVGDTITVYGKVMNYYNKNNSTNTYEFTGISVLLNQVAATAAS